MSIDPASVFSNLENLQLKSDLFRNVKCFVTGTLDPKISKLLEDGGVSLSRFMDFSTHVVCGLNYDENDITEAAELYDIPTVTEAWVVASVHLGRLASTKAYFPLKTGIFCGLRFAVTQLDSRDLRRLYAVLTFHGGTFSVRLDRNTTHLVCGSPRGAAYSKAVAGGTGVQIVTPDWVADCLKSTSLKPVAVYHPRLLLEQVFLKQGATVKGTTEKQPLNSILGFDFEEGIAKTEVPTHGSGRKEEPKPRLIGQQGAESTTGGAKQGGQAQLSTASRYTRPQQQQQQQQQGPQHTHRLRGPAPQTLNTQQQNQQQLQKALQAQQQQLQQQQQMTMNSTNNNILQQSLQHPTTTVQPQQQPLQQTQMNFQQSASQSGTIIQQIIQSPLQNSPQTQGPHQMQQTPQQQQGKQNIQVVYKSGPNQQQQTQLQVQQQQQYNQTAVTTVATGIDGQPQPKQILRQITINQTQLQPGQQMMQGQMQQQMQSQAAGQQTIQVSQSQPLQQQIIHVQRTMGGPQQQSDNRAGPFHQQQQQLQFQQQQLSSQQGVVTTSSGQISMMNNNSQAVQGQPKFIQQTIIQSMGPNYQTVTKQVVVEQQDQQSQQQMQQLQSQQTSMQNVQQQMQQQQMKPMGPASAGGPQPGQPQVVQRIVQQQVFPGQNIVIVNQSTNQQQIISGPGAQPMNPQQRLQYMQQQQKQQLQQQHQQIVVSSSGPMSNAASQQQQQQQIIQQRTVVAAQDNGQSVMLQQRAQLQQQQMQGQPQQLLIQQGQQQPMQQQIIQTSAGGQQQTIVVQQQPGTMMQQGAMVQQQIISTSHQPSQQQQQQQQQQLIVNQQQIIQQPMVANQMQQQPSQQQMLQQTIGATGPMMQQAGQPIMQQQILGPNGAPQQQLMAGGNGGEQMLQAGLGGNEMMLPQQQQQPQTPTQQPPGTPQPWTPQSPLQQPGTPFQAQQSPQQMQQSPQQMQQSPVQQQGAGMLPSGTTIVQQTIVQSPQGHPQAVPGQPGVPGQPQFIRTTLRPQGPRQLIQLDPQARAELMKLDPAGQQEFISRLQAKHNHMQRQQAAFQARPGHPGAHPGARQQIVIRSPMPPGMNQQQQVRWLHHQQQQQQQQNARQVVVRPVAPGLSPITQQTIGTGPPGTPYPIDPNASAQQQRMQQHRLLQMQLQRDQVQKNQQQQQQQQQQPGAPQMGGQMISPRTPGGGFPSEVVVGADGSTMVVQQQTLVGASGQPTAGGPVPQSPQDPAGGSLQAHQQQQQQQMQSKTKTALANMLSNRLGNGGTVPGGPVGGTSGTLVDGPGPGAEPSAAGTLRLMTAQHNAALQQTLGRSPQDILALQQQQQACQQQQQQQIQQQQQQQQIQHNLLHPQQQQQVVRRTLGNITNSGVVQTPLGPGGPGPVVNQIQIQSSGAGGIPVPVPGAAGPVMIQNAVAVAAAAMKGGGPAQFSPGRAPLHRPQYYGHNPNLKLHPELFLLGCTFYIIEYDETHSAAEIEEWKMIIKKHGGEIESYYGPKVTHVLCRTQRHGVVMQAIRDAKRCITTYWLNDIIVKRQLQPPWQALHLPTPAIFGTQKPATKHNMSITGFEGEERVRIKQMIEESGARMTPYFSKSNTVLLCRQIDNPKYKFAKEWNVPAVNTIWLSDILLGNLNAMQQCEAPKYQQFNLTCHFRVDYNLVMHLMTAWKSPINLTQESHERVKRTLSELPPPATGVKKPRTLPLMEPVPAEIVCQRQPASDAVPSVLFSQIDNTEGLTRAVIALGGKVVTGATEATHLVMTRVARTVKLILALATVRHLLSSKWLSDSATAGYFLPIEAYKLDVAELNEQFKSDLHQVLETPARTKLFEGKVFFVTPQVKPSCKDVRQMIELGGGTVEKNPRTIKRIRETNAEKAGSYVIVSCPEDRIIIQPFIQKGKHAVCQICTTEYVMQSIMQQRLLIEPHIIKWELGS